MGDRFSAFEEAVTGEPVDVVIGDSMAEITMSMVTAGFRAQPEGQHRFYSEFFLRQLRPQLGVLAERGIKVVTNAGVYNPAGPAEVIRGEITKRGLDLTVAYITGDDLRAHAAQLLAESELSHLDTGAPLTSDPADLLAVHAYLSGWGIKSALGEGADIVVTGRVADASLVTGPAAWWHGWAHGELDKIAGATAAAHVIECGPQAAGGNFAGFTEIADNLLGQVHDVGNVGLADQPRPSGDRLPHCRGARPPARRPRPRRWAITVSTVTAPPSAARLVITNVPSSATVERYELPKLRGLSFVLTGYFAPSGSANLALDQIGESLGEFLRARHVDVPVALLPADSSIGK